jgi:hypothetical protein
LLHRETRDNPEPKNKKERVESGKGGASGSQRDKTRQAEQHDMIYLPFHDFLSICTCPSHLVSHLFIYFSLDHRDLFSNFSFSPKTTSNPKENTKI